MTDEVKKVLILGGAGYIGSVLTRMLLEKGYETTVFDRLLFGRESMDDLQTKPGFKLIQGDLRDIAAVSAAIQGQDAVILLAALVGEPACDRDPMETVDVNFLGSLNAARTALYYGVKRFLFASTDSCYGIQEGILYENSSLNPISLYASLKRDMESELLALPDLNPVILRLATVYGLSPRMRFDLIINILTMHAVVNNRIKIFGGKQWRPLVHTVDVARGFITALEAPLEKVKGQVFNIGSNEQNYQIGTLGDLVLDIFPDIEVETIEQPPDLRDYHVNFDKAETVMGYKAIKTPADGVREIAEAIKSGPDQEPARFRISQTPESERNMTTVSLDDIIKGIEPLQHFASFSPPLIGEEEIREVVDTLKSGWLTTGPKTERFENETAAYCGGGQALAVNSCTAALHLALAVLEIGESDGVITTPYTFASTGHVIMYQKARPFLVDVHPDDFNLDPDKVRRFLEKECTPGKNGGHPVHKDTGKTIKVLLPVHYGGQPCRMHELQQIAREYNLFLVEDAAHAVGASYRGEKIGYLGDITCLSFYATKNMTTGEGGMVLTRNKDWAARMRIMSMYGISDARRIWARYAPKGSWVYDVAELGFKYNMMDIQAALGLHQLARLDHFIARRKENAAVYNEILGGCEQVRLPRIRDDVDPAWHLFPLLLNTESLKINRDEFIEALKALNIGTSVLFIPLHLHSYYNKTLGYGEGDFPEAENLFRRVVNLPISPAASIEIITQIARTTARLLEAVS